VIVQYDEQADLVHTLRADEPLGQWQQEALDLSAYAGQEVAVTFLVHTDEEVPSTSGGLWGVNTNADLHAHWHDLTHTCPARPPARRPEEPLVKRGGLGLRQ